MDTLAGVVWYHTDNHHTIKYYVSYYLYLPMYVQGREYCNCCLAARENGKHHTVVFVARLPARKCDGNRLNVPGFKH